MFIYKITNISNQKVYIGQTRQKISIRFSQHKTNLKLNRHCNKHLQSSWNTYGESSFVFKQIDKFEEYNLENLNISEQYWIAKFESNNPEKGYNLTSGGLVCEFSKEARQNMSDAQKIFHQTEKGKKRLEELASYNKGKMPWNKESIGICSAWNKGLKTGPQSSELILKRTKAMIGKNKGVLNASFGKPAVNRKPIVCNETKEEFSSITDAAKNYSGKREHLRDHLKGNRIKFKGLTFNYREIKND